MCAIARNVLRDEIKRVRRAPRLSALAQVELDAADATIELDDNGTRISALRECLKQLPSEGAELVQRYYTDGQPLAVCAQAMGKSVSAVKSYLHWLRGKLQVCVSSRLGQIQP